MIKILEHIEGLVSTKISIIRTVFSIFKLEARLAGLSVFPLLLNVCMLFVILITFWLSAMLLVGYFALVFFGTVLIATTIVLLINLVLLFGLVKYLTFNLQNMSFEKTRAYLAPKENSDNELKKTINSSNCEPGKNITKSTNPTDQA